jgi:hypothetical protein
MRPAIDRFMARVSPEPNTGCWLWTGSLSGAYGRFSFTRENEQRAHRASWVLFRGPIPDSMHVCHKCDNPPCVNPDHLFLGTHTDNMADMARKGHVNRNPRPAGWQRHKTRCKNGHEFSQENTYRSHGTWRECRRCRQEEAASRRLSADQRARKTELQRNRRAALGVERGTK